LYRAISEVSYGHAGVRGGIRRAFSGEYSPFVQSNLVMCLGGACQFSEDSKALLDYVSKQYNDQNAQNLTLRIAETLRENDIMLNTMFERAKAFFGQEKFNQLQQEVMQTMMIKPSDEMSEMHM
jgi:hypothetical protein